MRILWWKCRARSSRKRFGRTEVFVPGISGLFDLDADIARAWEKREDEFYSMAKEAP